jgi:hypothetical protein
MRVATIVVVLIIHVGFFILFVAERRYLRQDGQEEAPSTAFFLPDEAHTITEGAPQSPIAAQTVHRTNPKRPATAAADSPGPTVRPEPPAKTPSAAPTAPDWRSEMQIVANNEVDAEERRRHKPSLLAPHDFSGVRAGSTDYSKPQFLWDHAATHRVEELPTGGLLINLNDRCSIVWVIVPFAFCKIGKIAARGDLFQLEAAAPGEP